jgi:aspartyl-tRNA(Asn)/glutamyl-tRNA(Gln) amidotransferase subunit A
MRGRIVPDAIRRNLSKQRIIVPTNVVLNELEPGILAIFEAALDRLVQSGVVFQRLRLPAFDAILGSR